jgi:amino-acid N-acetyltransferase
MSIRRARGEDLRAVLALLEENDLPAEGATEHLGSFFVAEDERGAIIGVIGLEAYPPMGLLRSLAVERDHRGRGIAAALCERLLRHAREVGLEEIYLLTIDASGYFGRFGFLTIDRKGASEAIRRTAELGRLCPATATLMKLSLDG